MKLFDTVYHLGGSQGIAPYLETITKTVKSMPMEKLDDFAAMTLQDRIKYYGDGKTLILFLGGEDISPSVYTTNPSPYNMGPKAASSRDKAEMRLFKAAAAAKIPMVGVCRGMQMLGICNKYKLIQHLDKHHGVTQIYTNLPSNPKFPTILSVPCDHHQAVYVPDPIFSPLVLYCSSSHSFINLANDEIINASHYPHIPQVILWKNLLSLGVQFHPEWDAMGGPSHLLFLNLIKTYLMSESNE